MNQPAGACSGAAVRRGVAERLHPNPITTCLNSRPLGQYETWRDDVALLAPFVIVADTPGGGLVVPVVSGPAGSST